MAGGPNININATANVTNAVAQLQQLQATITRLQQVAQAGGGQTLGTLPAAVRQILDSVNPLTAALSKVQEQMQELNRVSAQLGPAMYGQQLELLNRKLSETYAEANHTSTGLNALNSGSIREFIVLGHEWMTGNWSRIPGSLVVLTERIGGLATIFSNLSAPAWGAVAAGGGLVAILGYIAYQAYQAKAALDELQARTISLGQGRQNPREQQGAEMSAVQRQFNLSGHEMRELTQWTAELGAEFTEFIPKVNQLTLSAMALNQHLSLSDAVKQQKAQWGATAESFVSAAVKLGILTEAQGKEAEALIKQRRERDALLMIFPKLDQGFLKETNRVNEARAEYTRLAETMAMVGGDAVSLAAVMQQMPSMQQMQPNVQQMFERETPLQRAASAAVEANAPEIARQRSLLQELDTLRQRRQELQTEMSQSNIGAGDEGNNERYIQQLHQIDQAIQSIMVTLSETRSPGEKMAIQNRLRAFDEEVKAAGTNAEKIKEIRQREVEYARTVYESWTKDYQTIQDKALDADRGAAEQRFQIWMQQMRRLNIEAAHNEAERLRIQQAITEGYRTSGQAQRSPLAYQEQLNAETQAQQTLRDRDYQRFAASERDKIQAAKGSFEQIARIYDEWAARAAAIYGRDSTQYLEIQREKTRASQQAVDEAFRIREREANMLQRIDQLYLQQFRNNMQSMVKERQISQDQAYGFDIQYTTQLYVQLAAQYDAILQNETTKRELWLETYMKRLQLEAEFSKEVSAIQEKANAEAKRHADQIADSFKKAFDQVGSSIERAITDAITGKSTRQQAIQTVAKGVLEGVTGTLGTIANQYGGKWLAEQLNIKVEEGKETTITGVLGRYFAQLVGLGQDKKDPEVQKSQQSLTDAIKKSTDYTGELTKAMNELTQALKGTGPTAKNIVGPGSAADSAFPGAPGAVARGRISGGGGGVTSDYVTEAQGGATRNQPIDDALREQLTYAGIKTGLRARITSGGQPSSGPNRVGSHRHDEGGAADLSLSDASGRVLDMNNPDDQRMMQEYVTEAVRAGATGVGAGPGYMGPNLIHIGGGSEASWGGSRWIGQALREGSSSRVSREQVQQAIQGGRGGGGAYPPAPSVETPGAGDLPSIPFESGREKLLRPQVEPPAPRIYETGKIILPEDFPDKYSGTQPDVPPASLGSMWKKLWDNVEPSTTDSILKERGGSSGGPKYSASAGGDESPLSTYDETYNAANRNYRSKRALAVGNPDYPGNIFYNDSKFSNAPDLQTGGALQGAIRQSIQEQSQLTSTISQLSQTEQQSMQIDRQDAAQTQQDTTKTEANTRETSELNTSVQQLKQSVDKAAQKSGGIGGEGRGEGSADSGIANLSGGGGGGGGSTRNQSTRQQQGEQQSAFAGIRQIGQGLGSLSGVLGAISPRFRVLGSVLSTLFNLPSAIQNITKGFDVFKTAMDASAETSVLEKGAKLLGVTAETQHTASTLQDAAALQAHAASSAADSGGGIFGGIFKAIPIIGGLFGEGGMALNLSSIPSAAGGYRVQDGRGGTLAVIHPQETVLPADLSQGLNDMIQQHASSTGANVDASRSVSNQSTLNYNANVTGYHPYATRSSFEAMLRTHSAAMETHVANMIRNGWRP